MRRLPLLAHGSVSRPFILYLLAAVALITYGAIFVTTPTEQDHAVCTSWLHYYTERIDPQVAFQKQGCRFIDITATSHGIYSTVEIRIDKPCTKMPPMLDTYFTQNKLGMVMHVALIAEGEDSPCVSEFY